MLVGEQKGRVKIKETVGTEDTHLKGSRLIRGVNV